MTQRLIILGIAVIFGAGASAFFFRFANDVLVTPILSKMGIRIMIASISDLKRGTQYSGIVTGGSAAEHTLVLTVPSSYAPDSQKATPVQFSYATDTAWEVINYEFNGNTLEKRFVTRTEPRELPGGALATVMVDPSATKPLRALVILYLRKTEL